MPQSRPIVTLMSDFGASDHYVASMKAAIIRVCADVRLLDVTHQIRAQDILCGAIVLERAVDGFLPGTVHLAVVDPGVGTKRRILIVEINRQIVVCPDNGLITWAWRLHARPKAYELKWSPKNSSSTFHGRDVMGPVAGKLACGVKISSLAKRISDPILLDIVPATKSHGEIIHIDSFGNAMTNVGERLVMRLKAKNVSVNARSVGRLKRTYADVAPGKSLALIGSSGLLEIAVRDGSAANQLKLKVGDPVLLK